MRILISMNDETGSPRTTRLSITNCTDTSQLIKQITKSLKINKNAFIFSLKNQIINIRILQNWPLSIYNIRNGSWIILQQNQIFHKKQPSLTSTSSLEKIQQNQQDFQGQTSIIQHSISSSDKKVSFQSKKSQKDYSDYFDQQLHKMLNYCRNNQLYKIANLLKQEPDIQDQPQRELLLQSKNKYVLNQLGQCGRNALHWAVHNQNIQIISFLLMKYSDPSIQTLDNYTSLQLAVIHRNVQIVKLLLLQPKVDCNKITVHGSALHMAVYHSSPIVVKILLQNGAKPEQKNNDEKMPIQLTELKQIKKIFQEYELKNKLRLLRPNITKGDVLKVASLTFRGKQRTLMSNPFKGDLIFYKQNDIVDHKIKLGSIKQCEKITEKAWLMDQKIKYFKIVYQADGDETKLIIGIKNQNILNKWISSLQIAITYVKNYQYVQKIENQMQLIEILNDNKNQIKVHKRQAQNKKVQSPKKFRYSLFDLKVSNQTQNQENNKKDCSKVIDFLPNYQNKDNVQTKSFISSKQGNLYRQSQILLGSVIDESIFDSPPNRSSLNLRQNSGNNLVTVPTESQKFPVAERISSAPNFRKQSADFSKISQFNFEEKKQEKRESILQKNNQQKKKFSFSNFEFKRLLGSGAFGQVYLTKNKKNGKLYAMKVLNKKKLMVKKHLKYAISETNILKKINHPFIIQLHHSFQTPSNLYLCLDYCPHGDLSQVLCQRQKFNQITSKFLIVQMIQAIQYLHNQKIIYRDLKPQNILIGDDGYIKLIDFGLSKENQFAISFCGSPAYLSPEMIDKKGHSFPTDIYGLGCVLYEMVIGEPPFFDEKIDQLFQNIKTARLKFPGYLSKQIKSLISRMLQRDPNKRIGSKGFKELKDHSFFKGVDWQKIYNKKMAAPKQIFADEDQNQYFKLQNKMNEVLNYTDQQYTQNTMINRIKGFTFSRQE